jgi:hypothetical protein
MKQLNNSIEEHVLLGSALKDWVVQESSTINQSALAFVVQNTQAGYKQNYLDLLV